MPKVTLRDIEYILAGIVVVETPNTVIATPDFDNEESGRHEWIPEEYLDKEVLMIYSDKYKDYTTVIIAE